MQTERIISPEGQPDPVDRALRPRCLNDYIGQPAVREQMSIFIQATLSLIHI